jgi:hypothetical protein
MKEILVLCNNSAVSYVPVPCRGVVKNAYAVWQTSSVTANDTVTLARNTTTVNLITAVSGDGLVIETGVPDTTNGQLIFDPDSSTATSKIIKITVSAGGACLVRIEYDDSAYVTQA